MGREVKRVPLTFDWPLHMVWKGYCSPYRGRDCQACERPGHGHGSSDGMSPEARAIYCGLFSYEASPSGWKGQQLSQEEVDHLIARADWCLSDYLAEYRPGVGMVPREPRPPTDAASVNAWIVGQWGSGNLSRASSIAYHVTRLRCKKARLRYRCRWCKGRGQVWCSEEYRKLAEDWQKIHPPEGDGWQLWETVSEGSPVSPVFATPEELARWLVANDTSITKGTTIEQWVKFIRTEGSAVSLVVTDGRVQSGVEFVADSQE